jgi:flagellar motor switch protein FliG
LGTPFALGGNILLFFRNFFSNDIPKPYSFVKQTLKSGLDISSIIIELNTLLPQLADFINQFNNVVSQSGINVITDVMGNMSIDVPKDMPDSVANNISTRIGIIDRLITTRGQEINELLQKGLNLENNLKAENPDYVSQLSDKIAEFKRLNESYKH